MKLKMIGYWAATAAIALETLAGGVTDLIHGRTGLVTGEPVAQIVTREGYPLYLLTILGVWKLLGGITLLAPRLPRLKEWAYAGIFFELTGALASGIAQGGDPGTYVWPPLILALLTLASWALRPPGRTLRRLFPTRPNKEAPAKHAQATISG
ncbi:MAG TPA: DoxX family protein [Ktedonobacterales bacterium]|nr:DoxX family protein [Ktedonobacterales bacterium]